jgi:hypothetical protein
MDKPLWSRNYSACQNCGTTRRRHTAKGYCGLCVHPMRAIAIAKEWDRNRRASLKGIHRSGLQIAGRKTTRLETDSLSPAEFERFRTAYIAENRRRLSSLKSRERCWLGETVDGLHVEYRLRHLARRIRPRSRVAFYGRATALRRKFGPHGLVALAQLLDELEGLFPWSISWARIWEDTYASDSRTDGDCASAGEITGR